GYELDLVGRENGRSFGDECCDDRCLVEFPAKEPHRLGAEVLVAPLPQRVERRKQIGTFWREAVLVPRWAFLVEHALEDPLFDEPVETIGEHVASDPETLLEIDEPGYAEEGVADNQPRPALTDDLEHLRDRARLLALVVSLEHKKRIPQGLHEATDSGRVGSTKQLTGLSHEGPGPTEKEAMTTTDELRRDTG